MFAGDPSRVERIQTEAEQKVAELPPPLTDDRRRRSALIARCQALYDEIRELGGGRGKVELPPGQYAAWKLQAQHSHHLEKRRDEITREVAA
jgi:hypothetical protein